jgi:hypothetical protein
METPSLTTKNRISFAATRLQRANAILSGFMVQYGPNAGLDGRTQEVRG